MLKLGEVLGAWTPGEGRPSHAADPIVLITNLWPEIVGAEVAKNSHPAQVTGDTLHVTTRSSSWSQQLSFLAEQIVGTIRARVPRSGIERLRFRVGKLPSQSIRPRPKRVVEKGVPAASPRPSAADVEEAFERFRTDVIQAQRAKRAAGWNECRGCSVLIPPKSGPRCVSCVTARDDERQRQVARLLFEAPWLGYGGTAALVHDLTPEQYQDIRRRVLARWWQILWRARVAKQLSRDGRERLIASSLVILKSDVAPERISPAMVRNVLGDELHDLIYGTGHTSETNVE